jgi:hypothetical protein
VPVRLALGSEKIYFISGTENLQTIFSKSRDLSTKALALVALVSAHGMPPADAKVYEADNSGIHLKPLPRSSTPPEKRLRFISHHHFQSELLGGAGLGELSRQFIRQFATRISERSQEVGDQWSHLPDLYDFVKSETFVATTIALCGEHIFKINPNLAEDFWSHDSWLPCILRKVPRWVIPRAFASRDKNHENIMKWHKLARELVDCSDEKLKDVLWEPVWGARIMRKRAEMYKHVEEISPAGRAASDLGMIWAYGHISELIYTFADFGKGKCEYYSRSGLVFHPHNRGSHSHCSYPRRDFALLLIALTRVCGLGQAK